MNIGYIKYNNGNVYKAKGIEGPIDCGSRMTWVEGEPPADYKLIHDINFDLLTELANMFKALLPEKKIYYLPQLPPIETLIRYGEIDAAILAFQVMPLQQPEDAIIVDAMISKILDYKELLYIMGR